MQLSSWLIASVALLVGSSHGEICHPEVTEQVQEFVEAECSKRDEASNDIILLAKQMCKVMIEMTDFTRGKAQPRPATTTTAPTRTECSVAWGSWTACNLQGLQNRSRACPSGQVTEQRTCFVECLQWSEFSACATDRIVVDQKKSRTRQCLTGNETQQEACHNTTTAGYTSDGWYRAANEYEYYYISSPKTYTLATTTCKSLDSSSTLASVGARAGILDSGLDTAGMGIASGASYWVGASDAITEGTWIFQDGEVHLTAALPFRRSEPNLHSRENCLAWIRVEGRVNFTGLGDGPCGGSYPALCERKVSC